MKPEDNIRWCSSGATNFIFRDSLLLGLQFDLSEQKSWELYLCVHRVGKTASCLPPCLDLHVGASTWTLSLCFRSQHFTYWATSQSPYSLLWIYSIFLFPSTTYLYLQHVSGNYPNKHKNEISSIILWCNKSKTYLFIMLWKLVSKWNNSSYTRAARVLKLSYNILDFNFYLLSLFLLAFLRGQF